MAWTRYPGTVWNGNHHPGSSTHGWACIRGSTNGVTWRSCSTHMFSDPQNYSIAYLQSENLRLNVIPPGPIANMVGGDFNLRPRHSSGYSTSPWRGSWDEGDDTCYAWNDDRRTLQGGAPVCTQGGGQIRGVKIDHTWALGLQYMGAFGVADIRCGVASDHCLYFAAYRWR
ncbi:MAG TPA: hypothetical protein VK507_15880 [Iamia sp.]|nr:hypothetical protein [Iamia sp.]